MEPPLKWRGQGGTGAAAPTKGLIRNFFVLYTFYIVDIIAIVATSSTLR